MVKPRRSTAIKGWYENERGDHQREEESKDGIVLITVTLVASKVTVSEGMVGIVLVD